MRATAMAKKITDKKISATGDSGLMVEDLELTQQGMQAIFARMGYADVMSGAVYDGVPDIDIAALNARGFMPVLTDVGAGQVSGHWVMLIKGEENRYYIFDPLGEASGIRYRDLLLLQLPEEAEFSVIPNAAGLNRGLCGYWVASAGLRAYAALTHADAANLVTLGGAISDEMRDELAGGGFMRIAGWLLSVSHAFPGDASAELMDATALRQATQAELGVADLRGAVVDASHLTKLPHGITEIHSFRDFLGSIGPDTWIVLDLDNTVMTSKLELGGEAWFAAMFSHVAKEGMNPKVMFPQLLSVYDAAQQHVRTELVEPGTADVIRSLQAIGVPIIGLTARGPRIIHQTLRQMRDSGVDLSITSPVVDNGSNQAGGVIFCDGGDKGKILKAFFNTQTVAPDCTKEVVADAKATATTATTTAVTKLTELVRKTPGHIIMLDDKRKHLVNVMQALESMGIDFHGFRYGYLDDRVARHDIRVASFQLAHLWVRLSEVVQANIVTLNLVPAALRDGALSPTAYADSFFHPDEPLHPAERKEDALPVLRRSISVHSVFHAAPHNLKRRRDKMEGGEQTHVSAPLARRRTTGYTTTAPGRH